MASGRVLVADDSNTMATFVESVLEIMGHFSVDVVHDGSKAINSILNTTYSMVILDHDMPGMKGLDVIRAIYKLRPSACPAFVLITSTVYPEIIEAIKSEGLPVASLIAKPFTLEEFRARIDKIPQRRFSTVAADVGADETGVIYYKEAGQLTLKVANTDPSVTVTIRGVGTNDEAATLKEAFNAVIAAKPSIVVADLSQVRDFDAFFLGFLIIFMGTIIENGRKAFLVLGAESDDHRFVKLGVKTLIPSFATLADVRKEIRGG